MSSSSNRRQFLQASTVGLVTASVAGRATGEPTQASAALGPSAESKPVQTRGSLALDANRVRFFSPAIQTPTKVMIVADTHLFTDDKRGEPYQQFSGRMARAYNQTKHFQTGAPTNPSESFEASLQLARESKVDLVALVGDIFSFPSEAAIDWVVQQLADKAVPYLYVAGNHDWHYEGIEGSLAQLRATWIEKRLKPLYQGKNPLMAAYDVHGIRFVTIDNSNYEILPEQLEFFRGQISSGLPLVLLVHIPLYAPGRSIGFGCGHPEWGANSDRNYELERRPQWPQSGHSATTLAFHSEVFAAPNLLGIFAGHIHQQSADVINGIPQLVTDANATGAYMTADFLPQPMKEPSKPNK